MRILDYFARSVNWPRRLWGVGVFTTLREVLEGAKQVQRSVLSESAVNTIVEEAKGAVSKDPAVAVRGERELLVTTLKENFKADGYGSLLLAEQVARLQPAYLSRWREVVSDAKRCSPERAARAIASHLLDIGFSAEYLHRWWSYRVRHASGTQDIAGILTEADDLCAAGESSYEVLVTLEARPTISLAGVTEWRDATAVKAWLEANGSTHRVRQHGGLAISIAALDAWAAVEKTSDIVDALAARFGVGTRGGALQSHSHAWVRGTSDIFLLRQPRRVEVRALVREGKLFTRPSSSPVDAAILLLGPLDEGPAPSAIAGGWAAVESVLSMPGDRGKIESAKRLAYIVACSWPRAELTELSYRHADENPDGEVAAQMQAAPNNRQRARVFAEAIVRGTVADFQRPSDRAALVRMKEVLQNPFSKLSDVQAHVEIALRRLYRQRNIVLHGGELSAVATRSALRAAAPLVGAGFDRIAHAWFTEDVPPTELAVRARVRLRQIRSSHAAADVVDLLER